ncbi:MAG: NTP transferase domain-containing protein [Chlorobiota bacterium]
MSGIAVVVLAAGKGKRIGDAGLPKVLLPLKGRPLLSYVLAAVLPLQPQRLVVVVGFRGEEVAAFLQQHCPQAEVVWQSEQLGTGHAVLQTRGVLEGFTGTVVILPGDVPLVQYETLRVFVDFHLRVGNAVTVLTTQVPQPTGYGRILRDVTGRIVRIVEERDATPQEREIREVNTGIIAAQAPMLFRLLPRLSRQNAQQEYYLTDIVALCRDEEQPVGAWCAPRWQEFQGINTLAELAYAEELLESHYQEQPAA